MSQSSGDGGAPVPRKETCSMDERLRFINLVSDSDDSFAAPCVCEQVGSSRKTDYKWVELREVRSARGRGAAARDAYGPAHDADAGPRRATQDSIASYLFDAHVATQEHGCPLAALGSEVPR